jgi:hypothetical protein
MCGHPIESALGPTAACGGWRHKAAFRRSAQYFPSSVSEHWEPRLPTNSSQSRSKKPTPGMTGVKPRADATRGPDLRAMKSCAFPPRYNRRIWSAEESLLCWQALWRSKFRLAHVPLTASGDLLTCERQLIDCHPTPIAPRPDCQRRSFDR